MIENPCMDDASHFIYDNLLYRYQLGSTLVYAESMSMAK
jgi:hypothetical protein